jgi:hypothetical protein
MQTSDIFMVFSLPSIKMMAVDLPFGSPSIVNGLLTGKRKPPITDAARM